MRVPYNTPLPPTHHAGCGGLMMAPRLAPEEAKDGGPAFPRVRREREPGYEPTEIADGGMTLRDYFATAALTATMSHPSILESASAGPRGKSAELARFCYQMADSMLEERAK
jgi:hypothetical protein